MINISMLTYHSKLTAHTGKPHPNMSTTFMGKSRLLDDLCKHTPKSALPKIRTQLVSNTGLCPSTFSMDSMFASVTFFMMILVEHNDWGTL